MDCICDNKKPLKKKYITTKYTAGGMPNVTLIGVEYYKCDKCGEKFYGYGNPDQLHQLIANVLITKKGLLSGKEIRFLRKFLGYSGAVFGKLIGYRQESLYRIEEGNQPLTESFDRLVRFLVASKLRDRNYDLQDLILKNQLKNVRRIEVRQTKAGKWKLEEAA